MGPSTKVKKSRRNSWGRISISLLLTLAAAFPAFAEDQKPVAPAPESCPISWGKPSPILDVGLGAYISRGQGSWQISFPTGRGTGRSVLDFKELDSIIPYASLILSHPRSLIGLTVSYGSGNGSQGVGRDTDFFPGGFTNDAATDASSDTTFWSADLHTTFSSASGILWYLKPFAGWQQYREKVTLTDGRWTTLRGIPTVLPILGLNTRYEFNWDALRLGLSGGIDFLQTPQPWVQQWGIKAAFALFPYIRYYGEGHWNLREDLQKDPSFAHRAENTGWGGGEGLLGIFYRPGVHLELEGGVRYYFFQVKDGTDVTYFSNGTTTVSGLDEAQSERVGFYLQITGRF